MSVCLYYRSSSFGFHSGHLLLHQVITVITRGSVVFISTFLFLNGLHGSFRIPRCSITRIACLGPSQHCGVIKDPGKPCVASLCQVHCQIHHPTLNFDYFGPYLFWILLSRSFLPLGSPETSLLFIHINSFITPTLIQLILKSNEEFSKI